MNEQEIRKSVRENYGAIARSNGGCCGPSASSSSSTTSASSSCCGAGPTVEISKSIGYSEEELKSIPDEANLGLGCGNPVAVASLKEGETVLDLGSGGGLDCFLSAERVGPSGKVIGVDMTADMIDRARTNLSKSNYQNIEFRLGEIENLPVGDNLVDAIISNCVINLSTDKDRVFREAFRVLKPGGRVMVSDIVLDKELPEEVRNSLEAYVGCVSGALLKDDYIKTMKSAGFTGVEIVSESRFPVENWENDPIGESVIKQTKATPEQLKETVSSVVSIKVFAQKPGEEN
ncbi:MAG: arsenite methyltransferase [bacterium]|nr:arsenite methyltransferase [bacterium]